MARGARETETPRSPRLTRPCEAEFLHTADPLEKRLPRTSSDFRLRRVVAGSERGGEGKRLPLSLENRVALRVGKHERVDGEGLR